MNQPIVSHLPSVASYVGSATASRTPHPAVSGERKRFVAKGHDAQLQDAQHARRVITINTMSGESHSGIIARRDKFTVTLETTGGDHEIFYKHAIESIGIGAPRAAH